MKTYVIKLESGEYITDCRIASGYLDYNRTIHRAAATELDDSDSQLVLQRLKKLGQKNAVRDEVQAGTVHYRSY